MIKHAWTTVCSKTLIDKDTNNISLDIAEQINIFFISTTPNYFFSNNLITVSNFWISFTIPTMQNITNPQSKYGGCPTPPDKKGQH
mgnify:CR=1 FL=1